MARQIHTYAALLQQIHHDLRIQHPDWVQPNGESPLCDSYEARLIELLDPSIQRTPDETTGVPDYSFECGQCGVEAPTKANQSAY